MNKVVIGMLMVGVLATGTYGAPAKSEEIRLGVDVVSPGQDEDWDTGFGTSVRLISWLESGLGIAFNIGVQSWDVNDEVYSEDEYLGNGIEYGLSGGLEGFATMTPLGGSVLYKIPFGETANLALECGVLYVIVDSDVKMIVAETAKGPGGVATARNSYDVELDDGVVGLIGAEFDVELSKSCRLFAGVGYQFDLVKGDTTTGGIDMDYGNELKASFVRAGLAWCY